MKQEKPKQSFKQRFHYKLDLWMSRGPGSMIVLLFQSTFIMILILGIRMSVQHPHAVSGAWAK